jgi:hypothetical protein
MYFQWVYKFIFPSTHLAGCNTHKAIDDIIKDSGIIRCDNMEHIYAMRLQNLLALVNGGSENWNFKE